MIKTTILHPSDLEKILGVERRAFIPPIQTTEEVIKRRLGKGHIYLGVEVENGLVGTLALRFAYFIPDFVDFCKRNPTFSDYAEKYNEENANAVFVYSLGIVPSHRNALNSKNLLQKAFNIAKERNMDFLVGDPRVPSYNGSNQLPYEKFDKNDVLQKAIDSYLKTGILPPRGVIEKDPVAGFYLKVFQKGEVLGITDGNFWKGDEPCGGHMVIGYLKSK